jgi:serine/threonine protein kinase
VQSGRQSDVGFVARYAPASTSTARATFAVVELVDSETLQARLNNGPLPTRRITELAAQIARGLTAAHEKNIVHRDLKPANIIITPDGRPNSSTSVSRART